MGENAPAGNDTPAWPGGNCITSSIFLQCGGLWTKSNRSFSPVESVFDKWPPCLPGRPPYQPFNIHPGTFAPVCDIQPWFPREMKTIESRCPTSYQSKITKYFRYFGQSQIVADTGPEGEGRALVENLTITGVVKAGRGVCKRTAG